MCDLHKDIEELRDQYAKKANFTVEMIADLTNEGTNNSISKSAIERLKITCSLFKKFSRELTKRLENK